MIRNKYNTTGKAQEQTGIYWVKGPENIRSWRFDKIYKQKIIQILDKGGHFIFTDQPGVARFTAQLIFNLLKERKEQNPHLRATIYFTGKSPTIDLGFCKRGGFASIRSRDLVMNSMATEIIED